MPGTIYEFSDFRLDCGRFELMRGGKSLRVERKPLELLILLAEKNGQLATREEIAQRLWQGEVFVDTEHGINTAIRKIRHALRDDAEESRYIQTVTGKGYRFIAHVEVIEPENAAKTRSLPEMSPSDSGPPPGDALPLPGPPEDCSCSPGKPVSHQGTFPGMDHPGRRVHTPCPGCRRLGFVGTAS